MKLYLRAGGFSYINGFKLFLMLVAGIQSLVFYIYIYIHIIVTTWARDLPDIYVCPSPRAAGPRVWAYYISGKCYK